MKCGLVVLTLAACTLAGCAAHQAQQQPEDRAAANAELVTQAKAAEADCNAKFHADPMTAVDNPKTAVARMKCLNDAFTILMPSFAPDGDLAVAYLADRLAIAERVQAGKLTPAAANAAIAKRWSQVVADGQKRADARNAAATQTATVRQH